MNFLIIAQLFERLEKRSKKLEKILILRDFLIENKKDGKLVFDMIAGNYQREIDKKTLGISLKTMFSAISFISKVSQEDISKKFNKIGDIGEVVSKILIKNKQDSLLTRDLSLEEITRSLENISKTSGTNSNKKKREVLSNLFLLAKKEVEYKFLARLLIDDLRVGVSDGILKEACVNAYFPQVLGVNIMCHNCGYVNLNLQNCLNCSKKLDFKDQESVVGRKYLVIELETPKKETSLLDYEVEYPINLLEFALRRDREKQYLKIEKPRELYRQFLDTFERKYNILNSFRKILEELDKNLSNVLKYEIEIGTPIRSMLGSRADNIEDCFSVTSRPSIIDFKYDGLRTQIHNNKGKINIFTRNLDEITKQFPEIVEFVKRNFSDKSFVIDSECVGYDFKNNKFLPFQMLSRRILTKEIESVSHINIVVKGFDLLYIDGRTLINERYERRRKILEELFLNRKIVEKVHFDLEELKKI
jgi:ATP-dependent DNA ligase I